MSEKRFTRIDVVQWIANKTFAPRSEPKFWPATAEEIITQFLKDCNLYIDNNREASNGT